MNTRTVEECQRLSITTLNLPSLGSCEDIEVEDQTILLNSSPCYYGGHRYWFICPTCNLRVGVLYKTPQDNTYECRKCKGLIYELTKHRKGRLEKVIRLFHKFRKIQALNY